MSIECDQVGGINLSQGVCDLEVPEQVRRAAREAIEDGFNSYTRYDGLASLRRALACKLERAGLSADPETEITVSAGATGALYCAALALLDPGDEVILFEPYYGYHLSTLQATGVVPAYVKLRPPDWDFDPGELAAACTPRTRGIVVCTPANPCGKVFTRQELETIRDLASDRELFVFTDEIYEYLVYDGREHLPPALVPGMAERTVTISGLSKTFSITGWRIGYSFCPADLARAIGYFNDLVYVCAPAPLQEGVARGLQALPASFYEELREGYARKRDRICTALDRAGLVPCVPQGAYYVLADISRLPGANSKERAMNLLRDSGVACVPGSAFYHNPSDGDDLARFCFAKSDSDLEQGCNRLEARKAHAR